MKFSAAVLIPAVLLSFISRVSAEPKPLPRSTPEAQGVRSKQLLQLVDALASEIEGLHSVMVLRHGHVITEGWWNPYAAEHNHVLFSLSKSFASTAVGMAVAEGHLSIDDKVLEFFPDAAPDEPSWNLEQMRVRDLLSMATGHQEAPSSAAEKVSPRSFLAEPVPHKPGTHFKYNTAATFMLSAIVQEQTGETLTDYLQPRLFEPLGIEKPVWDTNSEGVSLGGYGLRVRTEDIAKFGQLYLQNGEWGGRRLLDEDWIALATSRQVSNGSNPDSDWDQGYGYQFWRCRHGAYRGDGAFGQYCVVMPDQDAVVAITGGLGNMQGVLDILWRKLLPAFHDVPLAEDAAAVAGLEARLRGLALPSPTGRPSSPLADQVIGKTFEFPSNKDEFEALKLESADDQTLVLVTRRQGGESAHRCGYGEWIVGGSTENEPTAASFAWESEKDLVIKLCAYETPFVTTMRLHLKDDESIELELEMNVAFGPRKREPLTGTTK